MLPEARREEKEDASSGIKKRETSQGKTPHTLEES